MYSFANWKSGAEPPKSWDAANAVDDGWTKEQLETLMRETVRDWLPPEAENDNMEMSDADWSAMFRQQAEAPAVGVDLPAGTENETVVMRNEKPVLASEDAGIVGQIIGVGRFDYEVEGFLVDRGWHIKRNLLSGLDEVHTKTGVAPLTDEHLAEVRFSLTHASNGKEPAKEKIADALLLIGNRRAYHPVRDYLDGLSWDGEQRLDTWLSVYAGAPDTALNRAFSRKVLCAAVRRIRSPGSKFDSVLVLRGGQGVGKSSLVKALCPNGAWFTDQLQVGVGSKEVLEQTAGKWIVEMAELGGLSRREADNVKAFVTATEDEARLSYARYAVARPRQFVLFGTINEDQFLSDLTGNRRWWIADVGDCDPAGLISVRGQLWAEAAAKEIDENLWLDEEELRTALSQMNAEATDYGPWIEILREQVPPDGALKIRVMDAWCLVGIGSADSVNRVTKQHQTHMKAAMAGMGFTRHSIRGDDGRKLKAYVRGDAHLAQWWTPGQIPPDPVDRPQYF